MHVPSGCQDPAIPTYSLPGLLLTIHCKVPKVQAAEGVSAGQLLPIGEARGEGASGRGEGWILSHSFHAMTG